MNEIPSGQITSYQSGQIDMLTTSPLCHADTTADHGWMRFAIDTLLRLVFRRDHCPGKAELAGICRPWCDFVHNRQSGGIRGMGICGRLVLPEYG